VVVSGDRLCATTLIKTSLELEPFIQHIHSK
jgi:hypothetical protein